MAMNAQPTAHLLVTDLDNTLWDWFAAWYASFSPMVDRLVQDSGLPRQQLLSEIREVHQARGTSEYSFLLEELSSLQHLREPGLSIAERFNDAIHVQNKERRQHTALYPTVMETLQTLQRRGVAVVAYTESNAFWTEWRVRHTGLDGVLTALYSSPDHDFPDGLTPDDVRRKSPDDYGLKVTTHEHTAPGLLKPNSDVLHQIIGAYGMVPEEVVYIGDSLTKDVLMAQAAGVHDVHAAYGVSDHREGYDLLRQVSHWTPQAVEKEREASGGGVVVPSHAVSSFAGLLDLFNFQSPGAS